MGFYVDFHFPGAGPQEFGIDWISDASDVCDICPRFADSAEADLWCLAMNVMAGERELVEIYGPCVTPDRRLP